MNQNRAAIILAAGMGTRMKSSIPKVMHNVAGRPMVNHVITACEKTEINNINVIVGPNMDTLSSSVSPHKTIIQDDRNGTGGAAKIAQKNLNEFEGSIFILNGDGPFITPGTLHNLEQASQKTGLAVLGCEFDNPHGYGRFITDGYHVTAIVEEKDCTDDQRQIHLANTGVYCVSGKHLFNWLNKVTNDNAQGEYYLTDIVAIAAQEGVQCAYATAEEYEVMGINDRAQLAQAEKIMQSQLRNQAMKNGVTMIAPETVYLSTDTQLGHDVIIEPNVVIGAGVKIGDNTHIHAFSHIEGASIGENASIGPFARIRPKSKIGNNVNIGNFIEVNRSEFKDGSKSKHLSYIGDAIIGEKNKYRCGDCFCKL